VNLFHFGFNGALGAGGLGAFSSLTIVTTGATGSSVISVTQKQCIFTGIIGFSRISSSIC
jgi:hypothetical protein